jgi:D-methionine transport system substrate-binding protein
MFKKIILLSALALVVTGLVACSSKKEGANVVTVGTISGPETQLMEVAKKVAKKRYDLDVEIVPFSDYNAPNAALSGGSLDANAFQHKPFLNAQVKARGYKFAAIGKTFIYPMGVYSKKLKSLSNVPNGAKVAVPNDPTNEARGLLLLQKAGLIKLKPGVGVNATPVDITSNPKHLQFVELDAAQLPRSLDDVTLAAINTTYAIPAHLSPQKDALIHENGNSPFVNLIVVRAGDKDKKKLKELVEAFQSPEVKAEAKKLFGDAAIAGWK